MATEMTKMIKRVFTFLQYIFEKDLLTSPDSWNCNSFDFFVWSIWWNMETKWVIYTGELVGVGPYWNSLNILVTLYGLALRDYVLTMEFRNSHPGRKTKKLMWKWDLAWVLLGKGVKRFRILNLSMARFVWTLEFTCMYCPSMTWDMADS